ncbi:MAG: tetratricopeptide repeat protein [Gammaproteobacteria bacterium]|nr:tetratricopeptide repeat protein [Gammaproteobacteria bacterium]
MASKNRKARNKSKRKQATPQPVAAYSAQRPAAQRETAGGRPPPSAPPARAFAALAALALCLLVAVSYFPATYAGFIWDDLAFTSAKPVQDLSGLWRIWFAPGSLDKEGHYWPVLYSIFWLEHKLWGFHPLGYHLTSVLLHIGVTLLLWHLLKRMAVPGAWFAAALFAVHPLHAESVVWVIGRKDLLASAFYLAAVLAYIRFTEERRRGHYLGALGLFMLGLLSKSIVITLPAALLLWHWWRRGRITAADLARALPFLLVGLTVTVFDWLSYKDLESIAFHYSPAERALLAAQSLWFYIAKLVWPADLAVIYPRWEVSTGNLLAWACLTATAAALAALYLLRRRIGRGPLAAVLFFAVTLSPTLGFVDYGYMQFSFVADRYQYLAGAGFLILTAAAAVRGVRALPGISGKLETRASALAVVPLLILGALTWQQANIYRDEGAFFTHITTLNPHARLAHYNLAREYMRQGRIEDAEAAFRDEYRFALEQKPVDQKRLGLAHLGLATIAEQRGQPEEAETHYRNSIHSSEDSFHRLTALLNRQQRYREALALYETFIRSNPGNAKLHADMGVTLFKLNRPEEALHSIDRALQINPNLKEARANREEVLESL